MFSSFAFIVNLFTIWTCIDFLFFDLFCNKNKPKRYNEYYIITVYKTLYTMSNFLKLFINKPSNFQKFTRDYSDYLGQINCCSNKYPGQTGVTGFHGFQGPTGAYGFTGMMGENGQQGPTGFDCTGATGTIGVQGVIGPAGEPVTGPTGPLGPDGLPGPTGQPGDIGPGGNQGLSRN